VAIEGEKVFEQFTLVREIGRGGMGTVWLALQEVAGISRPVGVKTLSAEMGIEPKNVQLFLGEAQVVTLLNHPNIVSVLQGGAWGNEHFIVMEYVEGETLSRLARAQARLGRTLPLAFSVQTIRDVALALFHAHNALDHHQRSLKLVHRDISPQNIMVRLDGVTKLLDFGIARVATRTTRTETGILRGKLRYLSPEQFLGQPVDGRTDQYALGIVLFELLTGMAYIESEEVAAVWARLNAPSIPAPSTFDPRVPHALDSVVLRMLSREPSSRFASCREVALALNAVLDELTEEVARYELVESLAGADIRARANGSPNSALPVTDTLNNRHQCPGCRKMTTLGDKFCPSCGRTLNRSGSSASLRPRTTATALVLLDIGLAGPSAVGPVVMARALRAVSDLGRESAAQLIAMRPSGLMLALGLPRAASDDVGRAVALAERVTNTVRLVDPGILAGAVITTGMGVVSDQESGAPLVMGPVLEMAERHRAELQPGRIVIEAAAARGLNRPSRELSTGLVELIRAHREAKASPTLFEIGREAALANLDDWVRAASLKDRVKVWSHLAGDGASSLLRLVAARMTNMKTRAVLLQVNAMHHAQPYGLVRRIIDEAANVSSATRVTKLAGLGLTARELDLTQRALERQSVERPDVLPGVLGGSLLKVLGAMPLVVLIDDAHLADFESLRTLNHIARHMVAPSAVLLVAASAGLEPLALIAHEPVPPVGETDFQMLWQARTGTTLDGVAASLLWSTARQAVGRAFDVGDEAVRLGILKPAGDRLVLVGSLDPCMVNEASVAQRVGALSDAAAKYIERAAILGLGFSRTWVCAALGLRSDEAVFEELLSQRLLEAEGRIADELTRAAILETMPVASARRARVELAFCASEAFEGDEVSALAEEARLFAEADHPNAIRSGLYAASRLESIGSAMEAMAALSRVLRKLRVTFDAQRGEVAAWLMRLALGCAVERGLVETRPVLDEALDEATRAGLVSSWVKGAVLTLKIDEAAQWVLRALAVPDLEPEVHARLLGSDASVALARGQSASARERLLAAFQVMNARPAKEPNFYWEHLNLLGRACVELGDVVAAEEAFGSALVQAERVSSNAGRARALTNLAGLALRQHRVEEALTKLETAAGLASTSLDCQELARVQLNRANVLAQVGRSEEARDEARLAEANTHLSGWAEGAGLVGALLRRLESQL